MRTDQPIPTRKFLTFKELADMDGRKIITFFKSDVIPAGVLFDHIIKNESMTPFNEQLVNDYLELIRARKE